MVLKAKSFAGEDKFMVHAGDSHFLAKDANHLRRIMEVSTRMKVNALFLSMKVDDPKRSGIIEGEAMADGLVRVKRLVEKPLKSARLALEARVLFLTDRTGESL